MMLTLNSICLKLQCSSKHLPCFQYTHIVSQPKADGSCLNGQLSPYKYNYKLTKKTNNKIHQKYNNNELTKNCYN